MAKKNRPNYDLTKQPTPVYEPEPLPGMEAPETFGVHPHHVYEKARIASMQNEQEDTAAMRRLQEVSGRLQNTRLSKTEPSTAQMLPGFTGQGAEFRSSKLTPFTPKIPKMESFGGPSKGADWTKMTAEERSTALSNVADSPRRQGAKPPAVTEVEKDVVLPPSKFTAADWVKHFQNSKLADVDMAAKEKTGLELPAPKVRKPSLRAAIKRAAETVAERHFAKTTAAASMDIKEHSGSALNYFKNTFTNTGSNEEVEDHIVKNYSHMLPDEYKIETKTELPRSETPAAPSKSGAFVKAYAKNPLSAFKGK